MYVAEYSVAKKAEDINKKGNKVNKRLLSSAQKLG